jgi:transposase-like protein
MNTRNAQSLNTKTNRPCLIEDVGKSRNGKARYWCKTHKATATGRYGVKLTQCEAAYRDTQYEHKFDIDPKSYPGGIALWGAVAPVYDTSGRSTEIGVHVHARITEDAKEKDIDETYPAVVMYYQSNLLEPQREAIITQNTAVNYYLSKTYNREIDHLFCIHCGEIHLDAGYFAVHPHKRHLCHGCGKYFTDDKRAVSNPIALLRKSLNDNDKDRVIERSERVLDIKQSDFPGGIQIWASNPSIVWTARRPEEEGIHVHVYADRADQDKDAVHDDTFGTVLIDGVTLDEKMVRQLMAQQTLIYLENKIVTLNCPNCRRPHFDQGDDGIYPHKDHICEHCGTSFQSPGKRRLVVSNPLVSILENLRTAAPKVVTNPVNGEN